ncbi:DUF6957 family protein [Pseudomonas fluorescens]|uniref:DUF6957 family protein n=1 Tax=Pseudomonas fluorescens TaxID=294 RepID=UPI001BE6C593|nr:hypothetical protein [Pseudomonas fluorescens]MBT2371311.1 hypothetical protein [Pseudomonas fluorescens]
MTEIPSASELLNGSGDPRQGSVETQEALIHLVRSRFPRKAYCLVEEWTVFRVEITSEELIKIHAAAQLPLVLFAHKVILDSQDRFDFGNWVRSTMAISFQDGFLFETRNTVYVLLGAGYEKTASLKTIMSIF